MDKPSREEQEKAMREMADTILYLDFDSYKELDEIIDDMLERYKITLEEWGDFQMRRRPVEQSLEEVGNAGIFLKDLSEYLGLPEAELIELLNVIGAVKGEDGRFRLRMPGRLPGSEPRSFKGITVIKPVSSSAWKLLRGAGAAGLSLDDLAGHLKLPAVKVLEELKEEGAVKGEDGRFRLPQRINQ